MKTRETIIKDNINLLNAINEKDPSGFYTELKIYKDGFSFTFESKQDNTIRETEKTDKYEVLNYAVEKLILQKLEHLQEVTKKHVKDYEEKETYRLLGY